MEAVKESSRKVCVTGAGGFLGSWLVKILLAKSYAAHGTVRDPIMFNPNRPQGKLMDEDCWSKEEVCKKIENWYCLCKTLAERAALDYAAKHGLDVVTVCPFLILEPLLQPTVNDSSLFLLSLFKETVNQWRTKTDILWMFEM